MYAKGEFMSSRIRQTENDKWNPRGKALRCMTAGLFNGCSSSLLAVPAAHPVDPGQIDSL